MTTDPVQTIKDEESKAQQKVQSVKAENLTKIEDHTMKKEKELEDFNSGLRLKGQASLEEAKKNAMNTFKEITDNQERNKNTIISQAQGKKDDAVKHVVTAFENFLH